MKKLTLLLSVFLLVACTKVDRPGPKDATPRQRWFPPYAEKMGAALWPDELIEDKDLTGPGGNFEQAWARRADARGKVELMALFKSPPEMVAMGVVALHIISLNFPFAGYAIMRGAAFQALGKSIYSMNISLVRQLLIIIPCAYFFAKIGGVDMVWWAFPCAEVAGVTMSILYTKRIRRTIINKMTPRDKDGNVIEAQ